MVLVTEHNPAVIADMVSVLLPIKPLQVVSGIREIVVVVGVATALPSVLHELLKRLGEGLATVHLKHDASIDASKTIQAITESA